MIKLRCSVWMALLGAGLLVAGCSDDSAAGKDSASPPRDLGADSGAVDQGQDQRPDQAPSLDTGPDTVPTSAWQVVTAPSNGKLQAIWGSGATNIFVVGKEGYLLHYDGSSWKTMASPTQNDLFAVWGSGDSVYAAGTNVILQYDQSSVNSDAGGVPSWTEDYTSSWSTVTFRGFWGSSEGELFAVGERGEVRTRSSDDYWWDDLTVPSAEHLNAIVGFGSELFIVGDKGTLLQRSEGAWQAAEAGTTANLTDVWGTSADDVYVSGLDGVVLHYNGTAWNKLQTGTQAYFRAIWGDAAGELYVAGESLFGESDEAVMHYDGSSWQPIGGSQPLAILDLWGSAADNLYAVTKMNVLRYEATAP